MVTPEVYLGNPVIVTLEGATPASLLQVHAFCLPELLFLSFLEEL